MDLAERLKYARKQMGMSMPEVKDAIGIGASSLSEFENGKREPTLSKLQALANLYHRSVSFFLEDAPVQTELVLWRERPTDSSARRIENQFRKLCEQYRNLEVWCDEVISPDLPRAEGDRKTFGYSRAQKLANDVRRLLGLGDRPGCELLRVLEEKCGIKVFHLGFEPSGVAASAKSEALGLAILLNAGNRRWRRNFDLAHELFHLLVWDIFRSTSQGDSETADELEEKLAQCFAANLLMPAEAVQEAIDRRDKLTYQSLFDIAREFDVSVEALLWRLHFLHGRGPEEAEDTHRKIERANELRSEMETRERDDSSAPDLPERYRALAMKALGRGNISIGRCAEYLDISRREAMKCVEQETDDLEEVQLTSA